MYVITLNIYHFNVHVPEEAPSTAVAAAPLEVLVWAEVAVAPAPFPASVCAFCAVFCLLVAWGGKRGGRGERGGGRKEEEREGGRESAKHNTFHVHELSTQWLHTLLMW